MKNMKLFVEPLNTWLFVNKRVTTLCPWWLNGRVRYLERFFD